MKRLKTARTSWSSGLVVLCRDCDGYQKSVSRDLKDALAEAGLRKRVRIVRSSCLDVCPKRATTAVLVTPSGSVTVLVPSHPTRQDLGALIGRIVHPPEEDLANAEPATPPLR